MTIAHGERIITVSAGEISTPQEMTTDMVKDANGNEMTPEAVAAAGEYMAAIRAFSQAAYRLNSAWDALQSEDYDAETGEGEFEGYPFAESFDEMAVRIATWENAVTIKRYADMRVVPAAGDEAAKNG